VTAQGGVRPGGLPNLGGLPLRRIGVAAALALGLLLVLQQLAERLGETESPLGYGILVLGLGLGVAVFYGIWRTTRVGVLIWIVAALFSVTLGGTGSVDRLAFAALASGWFIGIATGLQPLRRFGMPEALMVLFLLVHVISAVAPHALDETTSLPATVLIVNAAFLPLAAYVIASQSLTDARSIRLFLWFLVWLGLYYAVVTIFQRFGLEQLVFPRQITDPGLGVNPERSRGPLLNSAADGVLMVMAFAAALFLGQQRGIRFRLFALFVAILLPVGIFTTQTRAIYLAAAIVVVGGGMFAAGYRRWYLLLLGTAVAVVGANFRTFLSADRTQGGVTSTSEIESRLNDWATAAWAFRNEPAFGWGIARFPEVNTVHHQAWPGIDWQLGWGYLSHNTHLAFAAEFGAVGLILWVGILASILAVTIRAYRRLPARGIVSRGFVLAFWLSYTGWILNAAVIDMRLFVAINAVVFVWAGIIAGLADMDRHALARLNREAGGQREVVGLPEDVLRTPPTPDGGAGGGPRAPDGGAGGGPDADGGPGRWGPLPARP